MVVNTYYARNRLLGKFGVRIANVLVHGKKNARTQSKRGTEERVNSMTKDKIIDGLKMTMGLFVFDPSTGETIDPDRLNELDRITYDACQGAIKELQSADVQPVVRCSECEHWNDGICCCARPERPKGKWIWKLDEGDPSRSMMLVCSICGSGRDEVGEYNFCHICGAKMINARGEQDD